MRHIGIQHRRKKTAAGEARPTRVCIIGEDKNVTEYELEDEMSELDFVHGIFPTQFRAVEDSDDIATFKPNHIKWRKAKKDERVEEIPENRRRMDGKICMVLDKVPAAYDGLQSGDVVGMVLGGSGDRFAFALSKRGEKVGASVYRLPSFALKEWRETLDKEKEDDADLLAQLVCDSQSDFYLVNRRERSLIQLGQAYRDRMDAMKARMGCEQRIRQNLVGLVFCSEEGQYPQGTIEVLYEQAKSNDKILAGYVAEEKERDKNLAKILGQINIYEELFEPIEGVGPAIAARLIVAIGDIRRFATDAKLKAYLGVHVMNGGKYGDRPTNKQFVRRRAGEVANWQEDGRQALYLLVDQFNRRADSVWGKKLREIKARLREKHPEVVEVEGKKRYTDGHIHKMALWRTATKFTQWLWKQWTRLESNPEYAQQLKQVKLERERDKHFAAKQKRQAKKQQTEQVETAGEQSAQ
ncbi:MAG: hypothetical protein G01um101413_764 [Parcubacteria group bacterium Gr01-1014_13]|nr:MAG: hypothetical protein G01um101413_764 [Parcubacteria group bacterium Gr01-1014_13]